MSHCEVPHAMLLHPRLTWALGVVLIAGAWRAQADAAEPRPQRCVAVEVYLTGDDSGQGSAASSVEPLLASRTGLAVRWFHTAQDKTAQRRYRAICDYCKIDFGEQRSIVYAGGHATVVDETRNDKASRIEEMFRFELYYRRGCSRCARAIPWAEAALTAYPGMALEIHDVVDDPPSATRLAELAQRYRTPAVSYPAFHFFGQLVVGWDDEQTTGQRILATLDRWSKPCPSPNRFEKETDRSVPDRGGAALGGTFPLLITPEWVGAVGVTIVESVLPQPDDTAEGEDDLLPIGAPEQPEGASLVEHAEAILPAGNASVALENSARAMSDGLTLPWFGEVRVSTIGLPLFTLSVGLVDGFNPCAMWVLLFLLSVLVNLGDRFKMFVVAGTFVLVSAVAYFAFIAAWLSVFQWVGLLRSVQVVLALVAIAIGVVHVKDFFAFHCGLTLSIPESAKPGIYARVRRIVMAESVWTALAGAIVLAVLVNFVELLCTAGLPCLYSQILTMQQLPWWQEYLYLSMYIAAYMFDDSLMVAGVVLTLGRPKMQEVHGRWLKLLSGAVILALGIVMLFRPEWLS